MSSRRVAPERIELLGSASWAVPPSVDASHVLGVVHDPLRAYVWLGSRGELDAPLGILRECRVASDGRMDVLDLATIPRVSCVSSLEEGSAAAIVCANPLSRGSPADADLELSRISSQGLSRQTHQALGQSVRGVDWHGGAWVGLAVASWSMLWNHAQKTLVELEPSEHWLSFHKPCLALSKDAHWAVVSRNYPTLEVYALGQAGTIAPHSVKEPATVLKPNWSWPQTLDVSNDGRSFLVASFAKFGGGQLSDQVMWLDGESSVEYDVGSKLIASAMHANAARFAVVAEAQPDRVTIVQALAPAGSLSAQHLDDAGHPTGLKWSADGTLLAAAGPSGVRIWKTPSSESP